MQRKEKADTLPYRHRRHPVRAAVRWFFIPDANDLHKNHADGLFLINALSHRKRVCRNGGIKKTIHKQGWLFYLWKRQRL